MQKASVKIAQLSYNELIKSFLVIILSGNEDLSVQIFPEEAVFFRENSGAWSEKIAYHESMPHLLLMAFLQRIVNGSGQILREYALGKKRVDLYVTWKNQNFVIEIKMKHGEDTLKNGLTQISNYMDLCGASEGHLIIVDRNPVKSWDEKISSQCITLTEKLVHVWTM
jgi:hypothetical protein